MSTHSDEKARCHQCGKRDGDDLPGCRYCTPNPACNCSLRWDYAKGQGPDPAHCPKHGQPIYSPGSSSDGGAS